MHNNSIFFIRLLPLLRFTPYAKVYSYEALRSQHCHAKLFPWFT